MFDITERNLMFDFASGCEIYDDEQGRVMSKAEVNDTIRSICFNKLGLTKNATDREIKRALKTPEARQLFNVIEEILDVTVAHSWTDNEFFNEYVEVRNIKDGDRNEFWADQEVILDVEQVSGSHHDLVMQRLGEGTSYSVPTSYWGVKVGGDIRLFLTGKKSWSDLVDAVAKAYKNKIQTMLAAEFVGIATTAPILSTLIKSGALVKADLDEMIQKVESANGCPAVIMGTKTALKNLNDLAAVTTGSVTWVANSSKEAIASTGVLGSYEGTALVEIPQKYADLGLTTPLVSDSKLFIMPMTDNKPIKFVDYGETELEVNEKGATMDDMQSYEVQRRMGVGVITTKYFGRWDL